LASVLVGAQGCKAIKIFGDIKLDLLGQYREFKHGISNRNTKGPIFRGINNGALLHSFAQWTIEKRQDTSRTHIAFDGKTLIVMPYRRTTFRRLLRLFNHICLLFRRLLNTQQFT
jgi:hypothetical protein